MKIEIKNFKGNPNSSLRRAGYVFKHREESEMSYVRSLAKAGYPRFHAHIIQSEKNLTIKIHLDQKKETYGKNKRHHGEYGNEGMLKNEAERLKQLFA